MVCMCVCVYVCVCVRERERVCVRESEHQPAEVREGHRLGSDRHRAHVLREEGRDRCLARLACVQRRGACGHHRKGYVPC